MYESIEPTQKLPQRLAVVGEAVTKDDVLNGTIFSGSRGNFVKAVLSSARIIPQSCLFAVLRRETAPWGDLRTVESDDPDLLEGIELLRNDLRRNQIKCVLFLGKNMPKVLGIPHSLDDFRGSIFRCDTLGVKGVCSYDALHCFQKYKDTALLKFDANRAWMESTSADLNLPERNIHVATEIGFAMQKLYEYSLAEELAFDVEGWPTEAGITCFSLAPTKDESTCFALRRRNGTSVFAPEEEVLIWQKLSEILTNPAIRKKAQNNMYEMFIMLWSHQLVIRNITQDTMVKHWELYPEFPKSLGFQTSLYTREPFFKDGRHDETDQGHWEYNAMDSAILHDIDETTDMLIKKREPSYESYKFKMDLLRAYTYMMARGCKIDMPRLIEHRKDLASKIVNGQNRLNHLTPRPINVKSHVDKKWLLYEEYGLPEVKKMDKDTGDEKLTADELAILRCKQKATPEQAKVIDVVLDLIKDRTDFSDTYKLEPFPDGRIRSSFNPVGTDTGRVASSATSVLDRIAKGKIELDKKTGRTKFKNVTSTEKRGTNLQNVSKWLRDVFIPDRGFTFWQYDYSGADAWTVAADCYALGNPRMLEHLQQGVKPSCVILMMRKYGTEVISWDVDKILEVQPEMKNAGTMYVCAKACQHGSNYGMGPPLLADTIYKRSRGAIDIHPRIAAGLQTAYESYYKVSLRTTWVKQQLEKYGALESAAGTRRQFYDIRYGRSIDQNVLRAALSFEPQCNTTYATNLALHRLYYDKVNRRIGFPIFINEPLLMIHDALAGQTRIEDRVAGEKILINAFLAEMVIHGVHVSIPAEGGFGKNWKSTD
jgi:hypothetical protein